MKHLHIHSFMFKPENPLLVHAVIPYDETHPNYNLETKGFDEKFPFDKITYVNVEDSVEVELNDIATKNPDNTWTFIKP